MADVDQLNYFLSPRRTVTAVDGRAPAKPAAIRLGDGGVNLSVFAGVIGVQSPFHCAPYSISQGLSGPSVSRLSPATRLHPAP